MKTIGKVFMALGGIVWVVCGLLGFIISLAIVNNVAGFWGVVIGFAIAPVTFAAAPWYALVQWGNWFPLLINYGGGICGTLLWGIGSLINGKD